MRGSKRYFCCHLMPRIATLFFIRKWVGYFLTTRYSVPNLFFLLFNSSIFWISLPNRCKQETSNVEPNFCFKISKIAAAIIYYPFSETSVGVKNSRKHCLMGEICSNCLLLCMMMAVSLASKQETCFAQTLSKPLGTFTQSSGQVCSQVWATLLIVMGKNAHRYGQKSSSLWLKMLNVKSICPIRFRDFHECCGICTMMGILVFFRN